MGSTSLPSTFTGVTNFSNNILSKEIIETRKSTHEVFQRCTKCVSIVLGHSFLRVFLLLTKAMFSKTMFNKTDSSQDINRCCEAKVFLI